MQSFMQTFMESPLLGLVMASAAEQEYIDKSGLSDEEKEEARITLRRFLRGSIDRKIPQADSEAALQQIAMRQPNNRWQLRPSITDEQLKAFLTDAKMAADDAGVAEQPAPVDPSEEVKKAIDAALSWNAPNDPAAMPIDPGAGPSDPAEMPNDPGAESSDPAEIPNSEDPTTGQ
jgi:hypothetical protein